MFSVPDLMTFLSEQYQLWFNENQKKIAEDLERRKAAGEDVPQGFQEKPNLDGFVTFARGYLSKTNQPLNVVYLPIGLGLRLQQGQIVGFVTEQKIEDMRDEGIPITRPSIIPGMEGVIDTSGISIFGAR